MLRNYILIASRHLRRHKLFSGINILCLAIGITFSLLIGVYVINQKSVNGSLRNAGRQYVIKSNWKVKNMGLPITTVAPMAKALREQYPNLVAGYYRFNPVTNVVSAGDRHFKENISICDTTLVSMYGFELLHGDPSRAFTNNNSAVITEALAVKLFGTTDAMGKTVSVTSTTGEKQDYSVSAVLKQMPYNTVNNYIDAEGYSVFVSFAGSRFFGGGNGEDLWANAYLPGMIELKPGVAISDVEKAAAQLLQANLPDNMKGLLQPEFVPMKDYYLEDNNGAVQKMITTLSIIAAFILLMAIINFININIGTSSYRLKEIGLRKVFGGARRQLILQHIIESTVISFIAAIIALCLYELLRPLFNQLLHTQLDSIWEFSLFKAGLLLVLVVSIGILAGIYPAFVLSASNIVHSAKGKIDSTKGGLWLRKGLLVVQFSLAIFIFIGALNVSKQVSYVFNKDLGYQRDQVLVLTAFPKQWDSTGVLKMESIKNGLKQLPVIESASLAFEVPDRTPPMTLDLLPEGSTKPIVLPTIEADEDYASTFDLHVQQGSFFNSSNPADAGLVLNETAVKLLGLANPVGKKVRMPDGFAFTVKGVVKDFNYSSFQQAIGPVGFLHMKMARRYRYLSLKLHTNDMSAAIRDINKAWKNLSPGAPFEYTFMDQRFQSLYQSELQLKQATRVATILNLIIVFMGIFGVVTFTLARRTKEIAVRKVLGAEVRSIIFLFIKDYAWLIFIANLIAWPLAWIVTDRWLENYAYRVEQNFVPYLFVAAFVFVLAFLFIAAQCFKAAVANPVRSLRTE